MLKRMWLSSFRYVGFALIGLGILLSAWYVLHGDIIFHSDIARDMVLLEEVVNTHKIPLLGPRTGAIPGIFHGPAWLFLNLPAFLIGGGNPVVIGWGWVVFEVMLLISTFFVARALMGEQIAIWSTALLSSRIPLYSHQLFNPSGISLFFPLYFYCVWKYVNSLQGKYLASASILAGVLVHFQIVFGAPLFLALIGIALWRIMRAHAPWWHLTLLLLIIIPLSTYIVFDLRHNFVQWNALMQYIQSDTPVYMTLAEVLRNRWMELTHTLGILSRGTAFWHTVMSWIFWLCVVRGLWHDNRSHIFTLYLILYAVFWIFSLLIFEPIKGYYFDFAFMNALILVSQLSKMNVPFAALVITIILWINFRHAKVAAFSTRDFTGNMESSWQFNKKLGELVGEDAPANFSVFTLDTDIFGYSANYGIRYAARVAGKHVNTRAKSPTTYLVIAKNTVNHPHFDVRWWREDQVKIRTKPTKTWDYQDKFLIEKYELSPEEVAIPEDVNLMSTKTNLR